MAKVDLTYAEAKTDVSLSLEEKGSDMTWTESDPGTWGESISTWGHPKIFSVLETKSLNSLSLESK